MTRGRFREAKAQLKGLRTYVVAVEELIQTKFLPRRSGTTGSADSPRQDQWSLRIVDRPTSAKQPHASSAAVSSSATQVPTPTPAQGSNSPEAPPSTTLAHATVFSTIQSNVRARAIRVEISD